MYKNRHNEYIQVNIQHYYIIYCLQNVRFVLYLLQVNKETSIKGGVLRGMCKVFSLINQKGGVAKSISTLNLGVELSNTYGLKVLIVDLDPQSNLTIISGVEPENLEMTIADVLISYSQKERIKIEEVILQLNDNLYLAPSIIDLSAADTFLQNIMSREYVLQKALSSVKDLFDVVLIDCQPSLSLLPLNALACSDYVIIPCSTEYLAYRGLGLIDDTIERVKENLNEKLELYGVIATKHESRTLHNKEILELLEEHYNVLGIVPKSTKVSDAIYSEGGAIVTNAPKSKPAMAYKLIALDIAKSLFKNVFTDEVMGDVCDLLSSYLAYQTLDDSELEKFNNIIDNKELELEMKLDMLEEMAKNIL